MNKEYKYDVAISFAEEDRNAALALALALKTEGEKKVYYYPLHFEDIWGHNIEERLTEIYSKEAKYAVVFVSRKYFEKKYASIELNAIRKRMMADDKVIYLLPVVLEEGVINKVNDLAQLGYIRWEFDPETVAKALIKLLGNRKETLHEFVEKDKMISKSIVNSSITAGGNINIIIK